MGITPKFGSGFVASQVKLFQERLEEATIFLLRSLGEDLAKYAKDNHSYTDRTGNLTNSIGYAIVRDGSIIYFGGAVQQGEEEALKVATKMAATLPNSFSLIIVAGMNYAAYVEAKGYNVILPAELKAKSDFPAAIKTLTDKANKNAKELFGGI